MVQKIIDWVVFCWVFAVMAVYASIPLMALVVVGVMVFDSLFGKLL